MQKSLILFLISFFLIRFSLSAQKKNIQFHSINTAAMVGGESPLSSAFQTVNGIRFSNWFSGIGIGIDNYRYNTIPLFMDARRFFGKEKKAFIYGDFGYNFPMKNKPEKDIYYYNSYHFSGSIYSDLGIGYQIYLNKNSCLLFSVGNSFKKLKMKTEVVNECLIAPCPVNYTIYKFNFNRMIVKAGLVF